jgi:hypothetical protein
VASNGKQSGAVVYYSRWDSGNPNHSSGEREPIKPKQYRALIDRQIYRLNAQADAMRQTLNSPLAHHAIDVLKKDHSLF